MDEKGNDGATLGSAASTNGNGRPALCDHLDGIVLHSSCEGPWFDSEGRRQ
jgi:hypothetical protein